MKAIGLFSGGLDSTLAVKLMVDLGIEVVALNFLSPFYQCNNKDCAHEASRIAKELKVELQVFKEQDDYIELIKKPKHGYGKNMNPCIDCRIYILKKTKEIMESIGASFVFTGEVIGQRPMSQRKHIMQLIEREADLKGLILRPLCAKLMDPTIAEEKGWVNRSKLLAISGRSRKPQLELAKEMGITDYDSPAGGCLLTDKQFAIRIKESFNHNEDSLRELRLLKYGRHFRLPNGPKVIVGRNHNENTIITAQARDREYLLEPLDCTGPNVLLTGNNLSENDFKLAAALCGKYTKCDATDLKMKIFNKNGFEEIRVEDSGNSPELEKYWIG